MELTNCTELAYIENLSHNDKKISYQRQISLVAIGCNTNQMIANRNSWNSKTENIKHKTNGYLIHIPLGLRKRLFYFRTVSMYTSVRIYLLYCIIS